MRQAILLLLLLCVISPALASYQYEFSGHIDLIERNEGHVLGDISLQQPFHGWFSYSIVPIQGNAYNQNASMSVTLDSLTLSYLDDHIYVRVSNNSSYNNDAFTFAVDNAQGNFSYSWFGVEFIDSSNSVFNNRDLPVSLDLADFDSTRLRVWGSQYPYPNSQSFNVEGVITTLTLIPEPATLSLLIPGCVLLYRRSKNHLKN